MRPSLILLALSAAALPAQAATVVSVANYTVDTSFSDSTDTPPPYFDPSGAIVTPARDRSVDGSGEVFNLSRPFQIIPAHHDVIGQAHANGNAAGDIAVQASFFVPGGGPVDALHARTVWSTTVVNQSGGNQAYDFNCRIAAGGILAGADAAGIRDLAGGMQAGYNIEIRLDGNTVWQSAAALSVARGSDPQSLLTTSGVQLGRTFSNTASGLCATYDDQCIGYTFDTYDGLLHLGTFANDSSFTVSYLMEVSVAGPTAETGAVAAFGDPLSLSGGGGLIGGGVVAVPEPTTHVLLLAGLGLVGCAARRRCNGQPMSAGPQANRA